MNSDLSRIIDRWAGVPLCALLTLLHRLVPPPRVEPDRVRRLAFLKPAEQGATVLAASAMRVAIARLGAENVFFLCFQKNAEILRVMNLVPETNLVLVDDSNPVTLTRDTLRAIAFLREHHIDAVVDLEFFSRYTALICGLSGSGIRVGL
ncbi:MAG TPA: glycosyltransferase family 9 protein, partial [Candidatus Hydrogenedentes bacterium]|nr:glycosyltransferase family 9 protein [Candidatus Hydrogenedentota bacterium]